MISTGISNAPSHSLSMIYGQVAVDPFAGPLSDDLCKEILSFESSYDLGASCSVSKRWKVLGRQIMPFVQSEEKVRIYQTVAFSKAKWNLHFGEGTVIGDDFSSLPQDIRTILSRPCRAFPGNRVIDTHILVYLPESITLPNAEGVLQRVPFTLNNLGSLMQSKLENSTNGFRYVWNEVALQEGDKPIGESRWVLMTKDVLRGSIYKIYRNQVERIEDLARRAGMPYEVPSLLEAATCIYMWYIDSGERLFNSGDYTNCEELVQGDQVFVGCFELSGLQIHSFLEYDDIGVAAVLREL